MPSSDRAYDYIIVGAGSAGCVLAARLSADPARTVLLLEAGMPDRHQAITTPVAFSALFKSPFDWNYSTTEQTGLLGRKVYWPRGKMLGGSSNINAHVYSRGHREDFDEWARLGNTGWSYADILPFFKTSENNERGADEFHGVGGPLDVTDLRDPHPLTKVFLEAAVQAGISANNDCNGRTQDGVGFSQVTIRNGRRWSCADAFLRPALRRSNLTVQTGALCQRIIFEGKRAIGIEYNLTGQQTVTVRCNREIILSGGAVNSPQLLMLSGVGPSDHLRGLGIEVVHELPGVGCNLQDHLMFLVHYEMQGVKSLIAAKSIGNILRYLLLKRGWLTSNILEAIGFTRSRDGLAAPDLEIGFSPVLYINEGLSEPKEHGFTMGSVLLRPHSSGTIRLVSKDPLQAPLIDPRYLTDEKGEDVNVLIGALQLVRRIASSPALQPYRGKEIGPGEACQSKSDIERFIRSTAQTIYHPVGTCKMGVDDYAVVDPALRVRGIAGLRIADASVMPTLVRGHTNAATIMIGEKAAAMILQNG